MFFSFFLRRGEGGGGGDFLFREGLWFSVSRV